jgi:hypothetical protein
VNWLLKLVGVFFVKKPFDRSWLENPEHTKSLMKGMPILHVEGDCIYHPQ